MEAGIEGPISTEQYSLASEWEITDQIDNACKGT